MIFKLAYTYNRLLAKKKKNKEVEIKKIGRKDAGIVDREENASSKTTFKIIAR